MKEPDKRQSYVILAGPNSTSRGGCHTSAIMDRSERSAGARFQTQVRCNCGCKKKVSERTRLRHLKRTSRRNSPEPNPPPSEPAYVDSDIDMGQEPTVSFTEPVESSLLSALEGGLLRPRNVDNQQMQQTDAPEAMSTGIDYSDSELQEPSEAPGSPRDWMDIGTPPPSPPRSPFARSQDDLSETEDGYVDITADDYREYDRWYAEDCQAELDEMRKCYVCYASDISQS
jgi:hypothetical protein